MDCKIVNIIKSLRQNNVEIHMKQAQEKILTL